MVSPVAESADAAEAAVEAVDETGEQTQQWADAAAAAAAAASSASGRVVAEPPTNLCVTVASRIPEMLAESMSLADEDAPPPAKR